MAEMFEQEIELEKEKSAIVPLLLIVALIVGVASVAFYQLRESRKVLTTPEAANVAISVLQAQGPATVRFHTGKLVSSVADKPTDPHYRLLEKAGIVTIVRQGKNYDSPTLVTLTPKGSQMLQQIPGVMESKEKDGSILHVVPLAERRLVEVSSVTMTAPRRATFEFTWKWEVNALGENFDAAGALVKDFNMWDRGTLINKYGAQFYHEAPTKVLMAVSRDDKGWRPVTEY